MNTIPYTDPSKADQQRYGVATKEEAEIVEAYWQKYGKPKGC